MKCEFCGGTLSLEEEYCPHCGQANKHAKQHIKDMRHYQGKFENTEKYVRNKATTYSEVSVRAIIIAGVDGSDDSDARYGSQCLGYSERV